MGHAEDLNPSSQTGKELGAIPGAETLWVDSVLESSGAYRFTKDPTTAANEFGGGERLAIMADYSIEALGAMARAAESSEVGAGAADAM